MKSYFYKNNNQNMLKKQVISSKTTREAKTSDENRPYYLER